MFSYLVTMSFTYNACCVLVADIKIFLFCWYRSYFDFKITQRWLQQSRWSSLYHLPITKEPDWYQGSADCSEREWNTVLNIRVSGKLRQSTTASSQCEQLSQTWARRSQYFDWWPHLENPYRDRIPSGKFGP